MAVTHSLTARRGVGDYVTGLLNAGGAGKLVFKTAGDVVVATLTLSATAFGASDGSAVSTAAAISADTNAVGGTIAKGELQNNAGTGVIFGSCTATGGGGDFQLSSVVVSAGQTVSLTSLTYTAPP